MLQANVISYNATIDACQDWQCDKDLEQEIGIQLKLKVTWTWYDADDSDFLSVIHSQS